MRLQVAALSVFLAGCASTPPPVEVASPPPEPRVVIVEKPSPPKVVIKEVVKVVEVRPPERAAPVEVAQRSPPTGAQVDIPSTATPPFAPAPRAPPPPPKPVAKPSIAPPLPIAQVPAKQVFVVIDGDTVDVNGARWRLQGFDAPEIGNAKCEAERAKGERARARLQQILGAAKIETSTVGHRDSFRRVLGTIRADGRDVGDILKAEGLARPNGAKSPAWCPPGAPPVAAPAAAKAPPAGKPTPCKGLAEAACETAAGCRWVRTKGADKNGRALSDYCRVAGKAG